MRSGFDEVRYCVEVRWPKHREVIQRRANLDERPKIGIRGGLLLLVPKSQNVIHTVILSSGLL
jgi:hypothetical protein